MKCSCDLKRKRAGSKALSKGFYKFSPADPDISATGAINITNSFGDISYNIYDNAGRLIASISPKGVREIINNGLSGYTSSNLPFTTYYDYNHQGMLLSTTEPDAGRSEYVYRKDGSIKYSQNAKQRGENKFSYTEYDALGRPIESGEFIKSYVVPWDFKGPEMMASLEHIGHESDWHDYNRTQWTKTYYDLPDANFYSQTGLSSSDFTQEFVRGSVSWTQNESARTWYSYDEMGQVTWMVQKYYSGVIVFAVEYEYDYFGNATKVGYKSFNAGNLEDESYHYYLYDEQQRLTQVYFSLNGNISEGDLPDHEEAGLQASYEYYLHGPLKRVVLGDEVQGIDYTYTINGGLKAINHPDKDSDPGKDGDDVFGMLLEYYSGDYNSAGGGIGSVNGGAQFKPQYNGNIAAMSWRTDEPFLVGTGHTEGMYLFEYDHKSQLQSAHWAVPDFSTAHAPGYTLDDAFKVEGLQYDANGNILGLKRYSEGELSRDLAYHYDNGNNQLSRVDDYATYMYNSIGQLEKETSLEDGKEKNMRYDVTGKVVAVTDENSDQVAAYVYDDRGFRMEKRRFTSWGSVKSRIFYVRDASGNLLSIYEQPGGLTGDIFQTEVPIYGAGKLGIYYPRQDNTTAYELTDHLGNVRAVVKKEKTSYTATMEDTGSASYSNPRVEELVYFRNIEETSYGPAPAWFNHTGTEVVPNPEYSALLDGDVGAADGVPGIIGPAITLQVARGDKIDLSAFGKYEIAANYNQLPIADIARALSTSYLNFNGQEVVDNLEELFAASLTGFTSDGSNTPEAYLNYIVFSQSFDLLEMDRVRIDESAGFHPDGPDLVDFQELAFEDMVNIREDGYIYVYVSNESPGSRVWFDDMNVTIERSIPTQSTDYYPFGSVARRLNTPNSYFEGPGFDEREDFGQYYRYGYQGQFAEEDSETGWNSFELRMYDPVIGRWNVVDPYRQYPSPYLGMGNNPVLNIDPDGGCTMPDGSPCPTELGLDGFEGMYVDLDSYAPSMLPDGSMMNILNIPGVPINTTPGLDFQAAQDQAAFEAAAVLMVGTDLFKSQFNAQSNSDDPYTSASSPPIPGSNVGKIVKQLRIAKQAQQLSRQLGRNTVKIRTARKIIQYDLQGAIHKNVNTPHVQRWLRNVNPKGEVFFNKDRSWVRPMTDQDLRIITNYLKRQ